MEQISTFIIQHAPHAHWMVFTAILLAGMNIPISIDALLIASAVLASTIIPEHTVHLYLSILIGSCFSAWIAYWMGRLVGPRLAQLPLFEKLLHPERIQKMRRFYERRGLLALVVGRFIPFGVRNALFMSTGMSKLPFFTFVLRDALACSLWATVSFSSFYLLGQHLDLLWHYAKTFNLVIFTLFGVAAIACIWYKRRNA